MMPGITTPTDLPPAVQVRNLSLRYGSMLAIADVSLTVAAGSSFALLGPNGAGKTTLMSVLATLLAPGLGLAEVAGHDVVKSPLKVRRAIGMVFQDASLDDRLFAEENLDFHGRVYGPAPRSRREAIDRMLALVDLEDWREEVEGADRICIIDEGRIIAQGTPLELKARLGHAFLHVKATSAADSAALIAAYPQARVQKDGTLAIPAPSEAIGAEILARFGSRLGEMRYEAPTLEGVFLALTGRALRDRADGGRAAQRDAGRRAGRR